MGWNFTPDKTESKLKLSYLCQVIGMALPSGTETCHRVPMPKFFISYCFGVEYGVCVTNVTCLERTRAHYGCSACGSTTQRWTARQRFIGFISVAPSLWQQIPPLHGRKRTTDGDVWHDKVVWGIKLLLRTWPRFCGRLGQQQTICRMENDGSLFWKTTARQDDLVSHDKLGLVLLAPWVLSFFFLWNALQKKASRQ